MNGTLFIIMIAIIAFMLVKNVKQAKTLRKDKGYVDAYMKILKSEEDASTNLKSYIETEVDEELKNRAKIVEVYSEMLSGNNPLELAEGINFKAALLDGEKVNLEKLTTNSDSFVWLDMDLALAKAKRYSKTMDVLFDSLKDYDEQLNTVVEYGIFKSIYNYLKNKDEAALEFPKKLLGGDYVGMHYDKQLIGVNKKLAAALLAYANQPLDDDCKELVKDFAHTQVGNKFLKDLGILDEYLEKKEEVKEEEK